ncbi:MAG TPA: hypothetical protein VHB46_16125 [Burkholderiales bacterium]|nr:hypothetical protein [Burkholderiales bacterium]
MLKHFRCGFVAACLALCAGFSAFATAATPLVDFGIVTSDFDCHGTTDRFSFVATWPDLVESGAYNIKLGNQCTLDGQQCTTNSAKSCQAKCSKGKCRAEFSACQTARGGAFSVVAVNAKGYQEKRYAVPTCK